MPQKNINYASAHTSVQTPTVLTTALGNTIIEIQGELILPDEKPVGLTPEQEEKYSQLDGITWAVEFGKLELDGKKATLYIGTSQRLLGQVKTLDPPLGLMRFPQSDGTDEDIELVDVLKHKIIFTGRPLPIM